MEPLCYLRTTQEGEEQEGVEWEGEEWEGEEWEGEREVWSGKWMRNRRVYAGDM